VASILSDIPQENLICEPEGRNTAPCIGLAAMRIMRRDPEGVMIVFPSDHYIRDEKGLRKALMKGEEIARVGGSLVVLGVRPTRAETGYGYIEVGESIPPSRGDWVEVRQVRSFHEKPQAEKAEEFLRKGNYLWNSGIFIWNASTILKAIERTLPELHEGLQRIEKAIGGPYERKTTKEVYSSLKPVSIDTGVLEKIRENLVVIPVDIGWSDVGSFISLSEVFDKDAQGNVVRAKHMGLKSSDNVIVGGKRLIATVGVQGMVIVETDDAVLVCAKECAQDVKTLVDELEKAGLKEYL